MTIAWTIPPCLEIWSRFAPEGLLTTCSIDYLSQGLTYKSYLLSIFLALFLLPLVAIAVCYLFITRVVFQRRHLFPKSTYPDVVRLTRGEKKTTRHQVKSRMNVELKTARTAALAVLVYTISWTPYAVVAMIGMFGNVGLLTPLASQIPMMFAKASCIYNPFLYTLSHPKLKKEMQSHLPRRLFVFLSLGQAPQIKRSSVMSLRTRNTSIE